MPISSRERLVADFFAPSTESNSGSGAGSPAAGGGAAWAAMARTVAVATARHGARKGCCNALKRSANRRRPVSDLIVDSARTNGRDAAGFSASFNPDQGLSLQYRVSECICAGAVSTKVGPATSGFPTLLEEFRANCLRSWSLRLAWVGSAQATRPFATRIRSHGSASPHSIRMHDLEDSAGARRKRAQRAVNPRP